MLKKKTEKMKRLKMKFKTQFKDSSIKKAARPSISTPSTPDMKMSKNVINPFIPLQKFFGH